MSPAQLFNYAGLASLYAVVAAALAVALFRLAGRPIAYQAWPALLLVFFLLALALHPLPDPATFDCRTQAVEPKFVPFRWLGTIAQLLSRSAPPSAWLRNLMVTSAAMNLALSLAIGAALVPLFQNMKAVVAFGLCLSLGIEVAQLTGLFGLYDCAYRQFDFDDLALNIGGIAAGFWFARRFYRSGGM